MKITEMKITEMKILLLVVRLDVGCVVTFLFPSFVSTSTKVENDFENI